MFAEVQLLLNLDQFCREHPHSHAGMYCDCSSIVLHTTCEMLVDYVTGIVPPPNVIPYSGKLSREKTFAFFAVS